MLNIELKDTIVPMCSANYKDRFVAEYIQLKIRYEMLKAFNTKIKAAVLSFGEECEVEEPRHDCPAELLREQQKLMGELLHVLEVRAVIEGIDLDGCMKMLSDKACDTEEVDLQDDTSSVSQSEPPSPAGEGLEEERPEGLMSLDETIKIVEYCSRRACDSCPLYYSDCMTPKSESALYYLKKYAESRRLQMSAGVS